MADGAVREARYWEPAEGGRVRCRLCPHECSIAEGHSGRCQVRENINGTLRTQNYGRVSAAHWDPIEKKPLFHFHPGAEILSLGTVGCNLACAFCQNWSISQARTGTRRLTPEEALALAEDRDGNLGIAYTYNEPFIWYEFVFDTAQMIRERGLHNVLVTNGYVQEEPLRELLPFIDAMNVDIKAMGGQFYQELCRGRPEPPRRTVEIAYEAGCLVEVTNLVIPNWNDTEEELESLVDWVASVGRDIPLHFSRYHPDHKFAEPPTPAQTLAKASNIASEKLDYVYLGNISGGDGENTACPSCGETIIARRGFAVSKMEVSRGKCNFCGEDVKVVGV